jgi:hypothetical protein
MSNFDRSAGDIPHTPSYCCGVDLRNRILLDAQADGLACVYCGRSWRQDGSLSPLRSSQRPTSRRSLVATGRWSLAGGQAFRCQPPCRQALHAYNDIEPATGDTNDHGFTISHDAAK